MKHFHSFRLDIVNHCLWCEEVRVPLTPKAFDVLRYLVEHSDRLVPQDEILSALWPEIYVNPEVIKKYILEIRKALGDSADKPKFVATFPRRGYQFVATVREIINDSSPNSNIAGSVAPKIVGREFDMVQLQGFLSQALRSQRQVIFITGEAGVGKTTLLDAFQQSVAGHQKLRVVRGQCVEGFGGKEAYYPVLEAISQWLRDSNGGPIVQALERQAPTWLIQFPSLVKAEQREALQKEIMGATRERMVREICEALESLTAHDPLVFILEDLHWVDPSTLDFISALARRRGAAKLLLLGTYRPADVIISQSPLKLLKQDLVIHNLSHEISLERLEESDVAQYLAISFIDHDFPEKFPNLIYRHSGGNALFMVTILQDMVKDGLIAKPDGKWTLTVPFQDVDLRVPETLDQLIEMQFQQLSAAQQRILKSASVAGERFSVWAITDIAEMDSISVEDACETLAERLQFIKASGIHKLPNAQTSAHYEFRHSLYREVLYRRLSESSRSKLHLQLARRLKMFGDLCEQEIATELALHFEGGHDYLQAVHYLTLAAENATRRFAYRDSIEILRHALDLVTKLSPPTRVELEVQIHRFIGDANFALGALAESTHAYEEAASRAEKAGLKVPQVVALTCAMWPYGFINPDQGIAGMAQAVEKAMSVEDPLLQARTQMLAASCRLVFDSWSQEDVDLSKSSYDTLIKLGDSDKSPYQHIVYGHVLVMQGNYKEASETFETVVAGANQAVSLIARFGSISGKTLILLRQGRLGEVLKITRAGRELPDENLARSWLLGFRESWLRILMFDFEGAYQICETIRASLKEYPFGQSQTIGKIAAAHRDLHLGKYNQAIECFKHVSAPEIATKFFLHWIWRLTAQLETGNAWLLSGNISNARATANNFLQSALSTADPHLQALAWDLKARVAIAENNLSAAREYVESAIAIVSQFEILVAAWQTYATAWQLHLHLKEAKTAKANRELAEACILKIANSFDPDEPLCATFLAAPAVRSILREAPTRTPARPRKLKSKTVS